jgi:hypothetical protein
MITTKRWTAIFLAIIIVIIGIVFTINYTIDPFGNRDWIVDKQYKPIVHERSEKYTTIFTQNNILKYDCVILGSSRVMNINPSLHDATQQCYNFGVHVANNPEKLFILQEWIKRSPLKTLYIGNELYNVHASTQPNHLNPESFIGGSEGNYLSFRTFSIALKTLTYSLKNQLQTHFRSNGSINNIQEEQAILQHTYDQSKNNFKTLSVQMVQGNYIQQKFNYDTNALKPLQKIKDLCDKNNVQVLAFITPMYHDAKIELYTYPSLQNASQQFRNDLLDIFGKVYDFDIDTPENRNPTNFYDPVHYRPSIGKLMIDKMQNQGNYGTLLTKP